ncbi:MAG: dipeptide epimerase [Cyanobacteria bacterium P01_C01_bin.73]
MQVSIQPFTVHKQVPLTISRGTSQGSTNLWVRLQADGIEGWGEATPFSIGKRGQSWEAIAAELQAFIPKLAPHHPLEHQIIENLMVKAGLGSASRAAIDVALQDWLGKRANLPLWQLWGLNLDAIGPTAVTIGISEPPAAVSRLQRWLEQIPARSFKLKLGSPDGIEADQNSVAALLPHIPTGSKISVDANGGWSLTEALSMADWLAERGIVYLEQPLAASAEAEFKALYQRSPLPIFADESCWTRQDIPRLAPYVHGINIKLMKSGGLSEARRMIDTARALGLQVMFGCYSDSVLSNTALAQLAPLADHLDLDSHLNLKNDPFCGAEVTSQGTLVPNRLPGLGVTQALSLGVPNHAPYR